MIDRIDRKELKAQAREIIRETRPWAVWVTLMVVAVLIILQVLSLTLSGDLDAYKTMVENAMAGQLTYVVSSGTTNPIGWLLTIALDLMSFVLSVGYTLYILRLSRKKEPSFGDVFDAFGIFLRAVWISILRSVVISLWSFAYALPASLLGMVMDPSLAALICLPFMIPMFMAAYSYRLAVFIMLDERRYGCLQCLSMSRLAMHGRKMELFLLDLSFIGWLLLCVIPVMFLWVEPYMKTTGALWYDRVMPGFREKLEKEIAARQNGGGFRPASRYHVPGEPWQGGGEEKEPEPEEEPYEDPDEEPYEEPDEEQDEEYYEEPDEDPDEDPYEEEND